MSTVLTKTLRTVFVPPQQNCTEREYCYTPSGSAPDGTSPSDGGSVQLCPTGYVRSQYCYIAQAGSIENEGVEPGDVVCVDICVPE